MSTGLRFAEPGGVVYSKHLLEASRPLLWLCLAGPLAMLSALPTQASAAPPAVQGNEQTTEGYVVAFHEHKLVVDVASASGARAGDELELWRPIELRHPVSRKRVVDRFLVGRVLLLQVQERLALAEPIGKPTSEPAIGDVVVWRRAAEMSPPTAEDSPPVVGSDRAVASTRIIAAPTPSNTQQAEPTLAGAATATHCATTASDEEAAVSRLFTSLSGLPSPVRIEAYRRYAMQNPRSRYARVLLEEARLLAQQTSAAERQPDVNEPEQRFRAPELAVAGLPLRIALELRGKGVGAVLYYKPSQADDYAHVAMRPSGASYYSATIPGAQIAPGRLAYFIAWTNERGERLDLQGSAANPRLITVRTTPSLEPPPQLHGEALLVTDYADWNRLEGNDRAWQSEGAFGVLPNAGMLKALHIGFGVYRGVGGTLEDLDNGSVSARRVGLTYGYLQGEVALSNFVSLIGRGALGLRERGVTGGTLGLVRLGKRSETNLTLGGEFLGGVGVRGITALELHAIKRIPLMIGSEVTNQPAGTVASPDTVRPLDTERGVENTSTGKGDIGVRVIFQAGYELTPELTTAIRASYQGRTINHAGPGVGGAVSYSW